MTDEPTTPEHAPADPLMPTAAAAKYLATSTTTVRRLHHTGELAAVKVGGLLKFKRSELDRYIEQQTIQHQRPERDPKVRRRLHDISELERQWPHLAS